MSRSSCGTPGSRYRAASEPQTAPADQPSCDSCGQPARDPTERADLTTDCILPGHTGPEIKHFCRRCAPTGPIVDLTCLRCGDGPLLVGDIAEHPHRADPLLTAAGWQLTDPLCPSCRPSSTTPPTPPRPRDNPDTRSNP